MSDNLNANPVQEEAIAQNFESGSEEAAIEALAKRTSEAEQDQETPTDEPQDDADAEPGDGETEDADDTAEELAEVEYEGRTYKVPPELQKAILRQSDYSRKMGVVAEKEKDYTQRIETATRLIDGAEKFAKVLAKAEALDTQIAQYEGVDWDALERDDPGRASILAVKLMRLQQQRKDAEAEGHQMQAQIAKDRNADVVAKRAEMHKTLTKELKGWGDEMGAKITQYAYSKGYTEEDLHQVTDPKWVIAMDRARRYDALQEGKAQWTAKAKDLPPVAKPGAKRAVANPGADAMARFGKSKSDEDAIAALSSRRK